MGNKTSNRVIICYKVAVNGETLKAYHHPTWVAVAKVLYTNTQDHPDEHYYLASIKYAKQFASIFADVSVIISQDNKAKVGLRVSVVGQTFHTLQSINDLISVADHDFLIGNR
ncbi:13497_t:CDS:2 [Funneliformis geosporum]|uniref:13497_t:CDS:1 n=1 Tax=Funneliformis geosporum TaxID=1117311 RepID=A0A9W4WMU5_9GLOM|nr:13497_t:CDS:2 [Funneliformis geosporum]